MLFLEYPPCSTCRKAKQYLDEVGAAYQPRHIVEQNPTVQELEEWVSRSGLPVKSFFNTSGQLYRQLELSQKLPGMSREQQLTLLATNGMLVKRPLLVGEDFVLVGFRQAEWDARLK